MHGCIGHIYRVALVCVLQDRGQVQIVDAGVQVTAPGLLLTGGGGNEVDVEASGLCRLDELELTAEVIFLAAVLEEERVGL